jgi:hypothetical protein
MEKKALDEPKRAHNPKVVASVVRPTYRPNVSLRRSEFSAPNPTNPDSSTNPDSER